MVDLPANSHQMLRFDWDAVDDQPVKGVLGLPELGAGPGCWNAVAILIGDGAIRVSVDQDTDQLLITHGPFNVKPDEVWLPVKALSFAVGRKMGWCWKAANAHGYLDVFLVAFGPEALTPACLFLGEASNVKLMNISPMA